MKKLGLTLLFCLPGCAAFEALGELAHRRKLVEAFIGEGVPEERLQEVSGDWEFLLVYDPGPIDAWRQVYVKIGKALDAAGEKPRMEFDNHIRGILGGKEIEGAFESYFANLSENDLTTFLNSIVGHGSGALTIYKDNDALVVGSQGGKYTDYKATSLAQRVRQVVSRQDAFSLDRVDDTVNALARQFHPPFAECPSPQYSVSFVQSVPGDPVRISINGLYASPWFNLPLTQYIGSGDPFEQFRLSILPVVQGHMVSFVGRMVERKTNTAFGYIYARRTGPTRNQPGQGKSPRQSRPPANTNRGAGL
jgi:hypothetical protein